MVCRVSCAGCSFLITVGAQVIVVADQTFVTSSSKVAFKTRIAAHTFMATHYFSLRGRVYTHNCDKRTHTLPQCTENMGTLCCFFFFFSAPTTLCSMFLLLFLLLVLFTMVSPKRWLFSALNPFTCGSLSCSVNFLNYETFFPPMRNIHENFHHYFRYTMWPLPLFSRYSPDKIGKRTNQWARKKNHGSAAFSHTHHTGKRWQSHNRVCENFLPFCLQW